MNSNSVILKAGPFTYGSSCSVAGAEPLPTLEDWLYPQHLKLNRQPHQTVPATDILVSETLGDIEVLGSQSYEPRWIPGVTPEIGCNQCVPNDVHNEQTSHPEAGEKPSSRPMCSVCGTAFSASKSLKRHMDTAHQHPSHEHQCFKCHRVFSRKDILVRHESHQHRLNKVQCSVCGKVVSERALPDHYRSRACQAVQALRDSRQIQSLKISAAMFPMDSLSDPLVVCAQLLSCYTLAREKPPTLEQSRNTSTVNIRPDERQRLLNPTYWELRGLATRTIKRALRDSSQVARCEFWGAIMIIYDLDTTLGLCAGAALFRQILESTLLIEKQVRTKLEHAVEIQSFAISVDCEKTENSGHRTISMHMCREYTVMRFRPGILF